MTLKHLQLPHICNEIARQSIEGLGYSSEYLGLINVFIHRACRL